MRFRSFGDIKNYPNISPTSGWSGFFGTTAICLDKHYVGDTANGEPNFTGSFSNVATLNSDNLFFSLTSDNILLIQGTIQKLNNTTQNVFILPTGFRPDAGTQLRGNAFAPSQPAEIIPFTINASTGILHLDVVPTGNINFNNSFRL